MGVKENSGDVVGLVLRALRIDNRFLFFFLFFFFHFPTLAGGATESPFRKPQPDFTISHLTTTSIFSIAELEITIWVGKCSVTERERSVNEVTPVFS